MAWKPATAKFAPRVLDHSNLNTLFPTSKNPWSAFSIRYKDSRVYTITALRWLDTDPNYFPLRRVFEERWSKRTDPFWWSAIAYKQLESKRTVRSYAARKLRIAFTESLKKKGYAPNGNSLAGGEADHLTGTAQLNPRDGILKTRLSDLVVQTDAALEAVLKVREKKSRRDTARFANGKDSQEGTARNTGGYTPGYTINKKRM